MLSPRISRMKERHLNTIPCITAERLVLQTEAYKKFAGDAVPIFRAKVVRYIMERMTTLILDDELIVGTATNAYRGASLHLEFQSSSWYTSDIDEFSTRKKDPYYISPEDKKTILETLPYWEGKSMEDLADQVMPAHIKELEKDDIICVGLENGVCGETTPDHDKIMELGLRGYMDECRRNIDAHLPQTREEQEKVDFWNACIIQCEGLITYAHRMAEEAERKASQCEKSDPERAKELRLIAENCRVVPENPPQTFYPFLCVLFVLLVILGIVPKMGGIKKAYERVATTGQLWPESSNMQNQGDELGEVMGAITDNSKKEEREVEPHLWTFIVPMLVVIVSALWLDDILYGVTLGIAVCFVTYLPTRVMSLSSFCDACYKGLEDMLFIAVVLVTSLFYRDSINLVGLPHYLIKIAGPYMNAVWLPAIAFILIGLVCFATGNIWSVPAVCTPIILPLAVSTGASIPLTLGAIISAACFGAQACFYSDVTLLSASACRINNVDYAVAQLPYIGIVTAISFVLYVIAGFAMA